MVARNTRGLSPKQRQIFNFIRTFLDRKGYPPTVRDIMKGCVLSSTSVVDYHLKQLDKGGYLKRDPEVSRGIELPRRRRRADALITVPVLGQIAAGEPIPVPAADSWETVPGDAWELPASLTQGKENVYALKVKGNSMIDALICDGDIILMQQASSAENGEMVAVWLKAEKEVTLKKLYREGDRLRLQPANTQMQPIYVNPENVEIQGKVIAVLRARV